MQKRRIMDALDLRKRPPRSPSERLGDLLMLARTIDKLRATLPGGNLGAYRIPGFSARLMEQLGIEEAALREVVEGAKSDDDVVAWVRAHSDPSRYNEINEGLLKRRVADRINDADFNERYPQAKTLPPDTPLLVMLEDDDRAMFGKT